MPARFVLAVLLLFPMFESPVGAYSLKPGGWHPIKNWTEKSADGRLVFVMRESDEVGPLRPVAESGDEEKAREFPRSGLYRTHDRELVWPTDVVLERGRGQCRHHVRVLDDGVHVVWLSHVPHGPSRVAPKRSWWQPNQTQTIEMYYGLVGDFTVERTLPGVQLIAAGKLVSKYTPDELVQRPEMLVDFGHGHKPWIATEEVIRNELTLETLDEQRLTFDLDTGELVRRESASALGWQPFAVVVGAIVLAVAAALLLLRPARTAAPGPVTEESGLT